MRDVSLLAKYIHRIIVRKGIKKWKDHDQCTLFKNEVEEARENYWKETESDLTDLTDEEIEELKRLEKSFGW